MKGAYSPVKIRLKGNRKLGNKDGALSWKQIWAVMMILLFIMLSGIGYVWSGFEGTQLGYDLSELKRKEMKLLEENRKLRLELARLRSPSYLEKAIRGLGLKEPVAEQVITLP